jgi:hypothetical protein
MSYAARVGVRVLQKRYGGLGSAALAKKAEQALKKGLALGGIADAKITFEVVPGTRYVRLAITSKKLGKLSHAERQAVVWRIVEQALDPDDLVRISMILTLTPEEQKGA